MKNTNFKGPDERFLERVEKAFWSAGHIGLGLQFSLTKKQPLPMRVEWLRQAAELVPVTDPAGEQLETLMLMSSRLADPELTTAGFQELVGQLEKVEGLHDDPAAKRRRELSAAILAG